MLAYVNAEGVLAVFSFVNFIRKFAHLGPLPIKHLLIVPHDNRENVFYHRKLQTAPLFDVQSLRELEEEKFYPVNDYTFCSDADYSIIATAYKQGELIEVKNDSLRNTF